MDNKMIEIGRLIESVFNEPHNDLNIICPFDFLEKLRNAARIREKDLKYIKGTEEVDFNNMLNSIKKGVEVAEETRDINNHLYDYYW